MNTEQKKVFRRRKRKGLPTRAVTLRLNDGNSKAGREWYDWLPVHALTTEEVFDLIRVHGQEPFWSYGVGMERKSCSFCIMGSKNDLTIAARLRPYAYRVYVKTERELNHTLQMSQKTLPEITGIDI